MILLGFMLAFVPATPIMILGGGISTLGQMAAAALIEAGAPAVLATCSGESLPTACASPL